MPFPFIVVDQNQLQRAELVTLLANRCREQSLRLLIPDVAGFEFSTVNDCHYTWLHCLEHLAPHADLVDVSMKMSSLWQVEIKSGRASAVITDAGATKIFRTLLNQINVGDHSGIKAVVDSPVMQLVPKSMPDQDKLKDAICAIHESLKSSLSPGSLKTLRNNRQTGVSDWLSSADGFRFVFHGIQKHGAKSLTAMQLSATPSAIGGFISGIAALSLDWLATGGIESARPKILTNDLHDLEYAIFGALSQSLATDDKRANRICEAITRGVKGRAKWLARGIAFGPENS